MRKPRLFKLHLWILEFYPERWPGHHTPYLRTFASFRSFEAALAFLRSGDDSGLILSHSKERP